MMLTLILVMVGTIAAALLSLLFSTLSYALRVYSRPRLESELERRGRAKWLEPLVDAATDLVIVTAVLRLIANILVIFGLLRLMEMTQLSRGFQYLGALIVAGLLLLFCSVAIPHAAAIHASEQVIAWAGPWLYGLRTALRPLLMLVRWLDEQFRQAAGIEKNAVEEKIEQEILSVVEEGEEQGVVDKQERQMIESVIQFRDTTAGQIMTARPEIIALDVKSTLPQVKQTLEESGHSRIPVYHGDLDHIIGILYARDLLGHLGLPPEKFDIRPAMRPPLYVPRGKPLRDLLMDFRLQKIHLAIVLDEYGGTAGLVTIEDILEELVGEISDEHEPAEPAMFKKIDEQTSEADARIYIEELNRLMGLSIPTDEGYDTLGGFVSTTVGRIPGQGETFDHGGARYTILDAEPQKVNRVRIQILNQPQVEVRSV